MRIGIEAQRISRKKKHGMDIVAIELIKKLQTIDTENEYFIFIKDDVDNTVITPSPNFKIITIKSSPYPYWEQVLLPKFVKEYKLDVLHCTSNTAPLSIKIPLVVTIHDIIYLEKVNISKGTLYQIFGNFYRRWNVPAVVKNASKIITVSVYEQKRILDHFKLTEETVKAVHNGVGDVFKKVTDSSILRNIKTKYNLPDKYVFFLGNTDPKKNVEGVMRALSILRKANKLNFTLLMLDIDRDYLNKIAAKIGDMEILKHISFSGYIPNYELPAIYSLANVFLYPSLRESFGIPILEAMACEVPVITSNTSSMPEVAGDAASYIDPFDANSIASSIENLIDNNELKEKLISGGLERVKEFSWKHNAVKTLNIYKSLKS